MCVFVCVHVCLRAVCLSPAVACLIRLEVSKKRVCVCCTSTQVHVCSLQVCVTDMAAELFGLDGWRRRKYLLKKFDSRSNPARHRRPWRSASVFSTRLFYRGVTRRSHGRVRPVLLSPSVCLRMAAAHAWLNPSYRCLEEIGIGVEGNKKTQKRKGKKKAWSILRMWKESRPQKWVFQRRRRSSGGVGFTPSSGGFILIRRAAAAARLQDVSLQPLSVFTGGDSQLLRRIINQRDAAVEMESLRQHVFTFFWDVLFEKKMSFPSSKKKKRFETCKKSKFVSRWSRKIFALSNSS